MKSLTESVVVDEPVESQNDKNRCFASQIHETVERKSRRFEAEEGRDEIEWVGAIRLIVDV
jgi:hypothetical protein